MVIYIAFVLIFLLVSSILFLIIEFFRDEYKFAKESSNSYRTSTRTSYGSSGSGTYSMPSPPPTPKPRNKYKYVDISSCTCIIDEKIKYKIQIAEKLIGLLDAMLDYKDIKRRIQTARVVGDDCIYYIFGGLSAFVIYDLLKRKDSEFVTDYLQILKAMEYIKKDGTIPDKKELKEFNILHKKYSG